jgi:hypothetical protein
MPMTFDPDDHFDRVAQHFIEHGWIEKEHDIRLADEIFARCWQQYRQGRAKRSQWFEDLVVALDALYDEETARARSTFLLLDLECRARRLEGRND